VLWNPGAGGARKRNGRFMVSNRLNSYYTRDADGWRWIAERPRNRGNRETDNAVRSSSRVQKARLSERNLEWRFPAACDSFQRKPHPDQPRGTGAFVHHDGRVSMAHQDCSLFCINKCLKPRDPSIRMDGPGSHKCKQCDTMFHAMCAGELGFEGSHYCGCKYRAAAASCCCC